jgi:ferrochelatase
VTDNGVLLMTYGSPASLDRSDIAQYLGRVRGGREAEPDLVDEFTRRYRVIGGSPLIDITTRQAAALEGILDWPVAIGMRFSEPSIEVGLSSLRARGVRRVAAIVLSPQFSPLLMGGYEGAITTAVSALETDTPAVTVAGAWHLEPAFIDALARRVRDGLATLGDDGSVPVLFTAHSLPRRVADREPEYLDELRETATLVAARAGLSDTRWRFCWQSAGHEPGEWMTPDFADLMPLLAREGRRSVLVAPVQFLADHLETLYDVDVGAREQAEAAGLAFARIESLNDDPGFIAALAAVAVRTLENVGSPVAFA